MKVLRHLVCSLLLFAACGIFMYPGDSAAEGTGMEDAVISAAKTTGKAVVSITAEHVTRIPARRYTFNGSYGGDDILRRFFEEYFGQIPEREFRQTG